jgi:hypothetical protein
VRNAFAQGILKDIGKPMHSAPPPYAFDEPLLGKSTLKVALLMAALIVCGVLGVSGVMKLHGYGVPQMMDPSNYEWSSVALFFRNHGFQLLWIPVLWTAVAVFAQRRDRGQFHTGVVAAGVFIMGIFVLLFFVAAVRPVKEKWLIIWLMEKRAEREAAAAAAAATERTKQE